MVTGHLVAAFIALIAVVAKQNQLGVGKYTVQMQTAIEPLEKFQLFRVDIIVDVNFDKWFGELGRVGKFLIQVHLIMHFAELRMNCLERNL